MRDVEVTKVPVELYKILKFEGLVGSGAEAKAVVAEGQVLLNGVVETQKRKKILVNDVIEFGSEKIRIVMAASDDDQ
jgi:ribosome-associated protein